MNQETKTERKPVEKPVKLPRPKRRSRRFRWELIVLPASLYGLWWLLSTIKPAFSWDDFLNLIHIKDKQRFSQLAILGISICSICAVMRVWLRKK